MAKKDLNIPLDNATYKHIKNKSHWTPKFIAQYLEQIQENEIEEHSISFYAKAAIKIYNETNEIPEKDKEFFAEDQLSIYRFIMFTGYIDMILTDLWENYLLRTIYNEFKNTMNSYLFAEEYMQLQQFTQERLKEYNFKKIDLWIMSRMGFRKFIFDKLFAEVLDERAKTGLIEGIDYKTNFKGYMDFVENVKHNVQGTEHYTIDNMVNILGVKKEIIMNYFYWDLDIIWKENAVNLFNGNVLTFGEIMTTQSFNGLNDCIRTLQPKELAFYLGFEYDEALECCSPDEILKLTNVEIQNFKVTGKLKATTLH
ncbi:MAG: hypothetical protein K2Y14_09600 [Burkholderiales bacterium]|nr:hypothetical protein [Burkholderiales bacterium]